MIAEDLGCGKTNSTDREQVECLQNNVAVHDILAMPRRYSIDSPIGPQAVIDHNFLPDTPKMMMVMGQYNQNVDILLGCNRDEGLQFTAPIYNNNSIATQWKEEWKEWRGYMYMLGLDKDDIDEEQANRLDAIDNFYLGDLEYMSFENVTEITKMYTDSWYCYSGYDFISRHIANVKENNTYQYLYSHNGENSLPSLGHSNYTGPLGVAHGDELFLQFHPFLNNAVVLNDNDSAMSELLVSLWKNFIKNGDPSTTGTSWEPIVDGNDRKYLHLNESAIMEDSNEIKQRMTFWDNLMNKFYD